MASVRGRLRGSSLDPARTALPLIRTGTRHTLGPVRISCHWPKDGKKKANFTRKKERDSHTPKNTFKSKKEVRIAFTFAFAFAFALHLSFSMVKGVKLTEKSKRKKKGVRIQAIIGRIRTRDPDLGHFGPDFDSGSGLESAFTDLSPVRP